MSRERRSDDTTFVTRRQRKCTQKARPRTARARGGGGGSPESTCIWIAGGPLGSARFALAPERERERIGAHVSILPQPLGLENTDPAELPGIAGAGGAP